MVGYEKKDKTPFEIEDFLLTFIRDEPGIVAPAQTVEQMKEYLLASAASANAAWEMKKKRARTLGPRERREHGT